MLKQMRMPVDMACRSVWTYIYTSQRSDPDF